MKVRNLDFSITIVGLGLIGGSYAMALRELNPKNLWAIDVNEESIQYAEVKGIIDKGYIDANIPLKQSDIVIISLYPLDAVKFIKNNIGNFKKGAIITDVSGIKERIVKEVEVFIPDYLDFVAGHPMAGREASGIGYASKDIFKNANYIITPTDKNKKENINIIKKLAYDIGCKNVIEVTPELHDKYVAYTSGVPHIIAASLMNSDSFDNEKGYFVGGSFRDATRVALINSSLWTELFVLNKENIVRELEEFQNNLAELKEAVKNEDTIGMKKLFDKAGKKRSELK
jgi:prephenate dehydrogenase